jgi:signal transduction histidine kinase/DNA-binding response OmpR family regulator
LKSIYASLENLSVAQKDFKQAKEYQMHYEAASDSFFSQNVLSRIADFQVRYQTAEKEAQLFAQNLSLEKERNRRNILLVSLALALVSLLALYQSFRSRQKLKQKELDLAIQIEHAETEKLRELDLVKSNFFANISHEFRTPLTMILSPIEQLIDGSLKGDLQKYYYIIFRNSRRLLDLVNQLLDLSKLESGKMDLRAVEADLGQFLSVLVRSFESLAERRQIILNENIPQQPSICFFDQDKIQKILTNLLSNALKFTPEGGQVFIDFNLNDSTPLMANLVINDTGIGIPIDQVSSLFERFSRTKTSELQSGSGIGLALTKELVVLHGGQIVVESSEGNGTKISLSLAVGKSFFKEEQISTSQIEELIINPQQTKLETEGREFTAFDVLANAQDKPMLLIVEDNNDVRNYIKGQFLDLYTILEAENGKLGLDLALEKIPDVIITDVMMPEMDGIQLCTLLKTNDKTNHIPVMMLTARGDQEDKLSGLATGADDYLIKPFHAKEIQLRVANLMSRQNNLREQFQKKLYSLQPTAVQVENMDTAFIRKVKESIEAHLDEEQFSVVELSMDLGMSRSQLYRKLSALTGYSPNEVIRNMRLERAKQLLLRKAGTVSEIAYLCGFSAPAYFVKCFREYFGMTPGEIS